MQYSSTARRSTPCLDVKGPYTRARLPPLGCCLLVAAAGLVAAVAADPVDAAADSTAAAAT
eukprot:6356211-Prymnesium_polylepis.1